MIGSGHEHRDPSCMEMFAKLSEYIDGELPDDLCRHIEGHMRDCSPCQGFLESLRRTVDLLRTTGSSELPADLVRELVAKASRLGDS